MAGGSASGQNGGFTPPAPMKLNSVATLLLAVAAFGCLFVPARGAGLYADEGKDVTSGDLNSQDYWWTKFDAMMLDLALKQHQPEGRIGVNVAIALRRLDDLAKKYPKHTGIQQWKARFEEIQAKINPDANRGLPFGPECPWDEANFAQLWVNLHWAKLLVDQKDWNNAKPILNNVRDNYRIMTAPERMKNYPDDLRQWVVTAKPEMDRLSAIAKSK